METLTADLKKTLDSVVRLASTENTDKPLRINVRQCQLLSYKASETLLKLEVLSSDLMDQVIINGLENAQTTIIIPILDPAVRELHQVLKNAEMLIEDCCCGDLWLEKVIYQGNLKKTFAKILYELEWYLSVLSSFLMIKDRDFEKMQNFDGELRCIEYFTLEAAAKYDLTSLRHLQEIHHVCDQELICKSDCLAIKLLSKLYAEEAGMMDKRIPVERNSPLFLWVKPSDIPVDGRRNVLGSGSFAKVEETKWLGHTCAWKKFKTVDADDLKMYKRELAALAGLDHPHIVHVVCCTEDVADLGIVMERLTGSLADLLQSILKDFLRLHHGKIANGSHASPFSIHKSVDLMLQIAEGLRHIHSEGMAHRDLNPQNILLQYADPRTPSSPAIVGAFSVLEKTPIVAKIADFGLTKMKNDSTAYGNHTLGIGTMRWMAPEVWKFPYKLEEPGRSDDRYLPKKVDVFSFGIICSEILTGEQPYQGVSNKEMYKQMKEGVRPDLPSRTPPMLAALIKKCWDGNPRQRPEFSAICTELRFIKALVLRELCKFYEVQPPQEEREVWQSVLSLTSEIPTTWHDLKSGHYGNVECLTVEHWERRWERCSQEIPMTWEQESPPALGTLNFLENWERQRSPGDPDDMGA